MVDVIPNQSDIRAFELDRDLSAVKRIWREVGWVDKDNEKELDGFFGCGNTLLATLSGEAECSVHVSEGQIRMGSLELPLCAVTAVTTSRIARGHAFAQRLTARQLAWGFEQGAKVSALGMFDQGFYDKLGFGTGAYDHEVTFDPATLLVEHSVPTPSRLSCDDSAAMHAALCNRNKVNGSVSLSSPQLFRAGLGFESKGFGLGYYHGAVLSHFMWLIPQGERGPYRVAYCAYQNTNQMMELFGLLKSLADQVYSVTMIEPAEIQLQSILSRPIRNAALTQRSKHAAQNRAIAWWQARILDVAACIASVQTKQRTVFQLNVTDPLEKLLDTDSASRWRGVAGSYIVELDEESGAEVGENDNLPQLNCSVNALSRLLMCVNNATSLAVTDDFVAPQELLMSLDVAIHGAMPKLGWDF